MGLAPDRRLAGNILRISGPAIAGLSSQMVVSVIETAMVGRIQNTTVVLAALGLGLLATWAITSVFSSMSTGTQVLVARRCGERDRPGSGIVLNDSLLLALTLGMLCGIPGFLATPRVLEFLSADRAVALAGVGYMQWRFVGLLFFLIVVSYRGFFNGIGRTEVFMYSAILINVVNIFADYLLIFGSLGFPRMGLTGAGCAWALSNAAGCLYFLGVTFLPEYRSTYRYYGGLKQIGRTIPQIIRISAPVSFQNILILLGFLVFVAITGMIGTSAQAASQVVITALFMSFLPCFGFGLGAQTLVGQSLGSAHYRLAQRYGEEAAKLATYFTVTLGALFILFPDQVVGLITTSREITEIARPVLRIAGAAQIFYASGIVLAHALQAAGRTMYVMTVEVVTHWLIFLPACYVLGVELGLGIVGAWAALPVYIIAYSTLMYRFYRRGSWLLTRI